MGKVTKVTTIHTKTNKEDPYGTKTIQLLEQFNEIELIVGIVGIVLAIIYQGIWVAIGIAIGVVFLESVILVEINTAKNVVKLRKQNERIERHLLALQTLALQNAESETILASMAHDDLTDEEEEKDPYKWHKIVGWSVLFIALTLLGNYFFAG